MNFGAILDFIKPFEALLIPILNNVEDNVVQPELKKLIEQVQGAELKAFLLGLDIALDALVKAEIKKLG